MKEVLKLNSSWPNGVISEYADLLDERPEYAKKANEVLGKISSLIDDLNKRRKC